MSRLWMPSRLNEGSLCNSSYTAPEAEARKIEKYRELLDNGYIFQPVALEVQACLGESSEIFGLGTICRKTICRKLTQGQFAEFFSANCPYEFAEFCRDNLPNMPPFPLVPRGPLGPPMFPSC